MAVFNLVSFDLQGVEDSVICQHMAAVHFYTDSIEKKDCNYQAYQCNSLKDFEAGNCLGCSARGCNRMGHWASPSNDLGTLYFTTQGADKYPYCYTHYKIKATSNNLSGQSQSKGTISVSFTGSKGTSGSYVIEDDTGIFKTNSVFQSIGEFDKDLGEIQSARVTFRRTDCFLTCFLLDDKWSVRTLEITNGQTQQTVKLCPSQNFINSGSTVTFNLC